MDISLEFPSSSSLFLKRGNLPKVSFILVQSALEAGGFRWLISQIF
jgi:hypothetical protein